MFWQERSYEHCGFMNVFICAWTLQLLDPTIVIFRYLLRPKCKKVQFVVCQYFFHIFESNSYLRRLRGFFPCNILFCRCKVIWAFCIFEVWCINWSRLFDVWEKKKSVKSLFWISVWILTLRGSSCVWVFALFCTMKPGTSKLDKNFDLVLLTFKELEASDLLLAYILWQYLVLSEPVLWQYLVLIFLGCPELR